jgi:hypothetical protein
LEKKKKRGENENMWSYDKYIEAEQAPKTTREIVTAYGYDIRSIPERQKCYGYVLKKNYCQIIETIYFFFIIIKFYFSQELNKRTSEVENAVSTGGDKDVLQSSINGHAASFEEKENNDEFPTLASSVALCIARRGPAKIKPPKIQFYQATGQHTAPRGPFMQISHSK